jgi:hypothetical protein
MFQNNVRKYDFVKSLNRLVYKYVFNFFAQKFIQNIIMKFKKLLFTFSFLFVSLISHSQQIGGGYASPAFGSYWL